MSECNWPTCGCQNVHGAPWCKVSFTAHPSLSSTVVHPSPALAVLAMRERAAKACDKIAGNTADFPRDHRRAAGQCGSAIRALPTTFTDAELLAAAMQLPAVRALVEAAHYINDEVITVMGAKRSSLAQPSRNLTAALAPFRK